MAYGPAPGAAPLGGLEVFYAAAVAKMKNENLIKSKYVRIVRKQNFPSRSRPREAARERAPPAPLAVQDTLELLSLLRTTSKPTPPAADPALLNRYLAPSISILHKYDFFF